MAVRKPFKTQEHHWLTRAAMLKWDTDYTLPVLGGAALLPFSAPAVYKNQGP